MRQGPAQDLHLLGIFLILYFINGTLSGPGNERVTKTSYTSDAIKSSVRFYLFSNQHVDPVTGEMVGSQEINYKQYNSLKSSAYMKGRPLKVLIHGYKRTGFSLFPHIVKDGTGEGNRRWRCPYIQRDNKTNVICVDWRQLAAEFVYLNSAWNTKVVGERVGEFLMFLKQEKFITNFTSVHIVGFSLGAQVAGFAGKHIYSATYRNYKVGRITGLDPAGPGFFKADAKSRLDKDDAIFTDIIHTSAGKSGISKSIGHVDFYPNGGTNQPGCAFENVLDPFLHNCSHERALDLFEQSIRGIRIFGCLCGGVKEFEDHMCECISNATTTMALMGEYVNQTIRGDYFFHTESSRPYTMQNEI